MNDFMPTSLGDLLDAAGSRLGLDSTRHAGLLWRHWARIVGEDIAAHAQPSSLRRGVLRVRADSPAWANEIKYLTDEILRRANEVAGTEVVAEVRLWVGSGEAPARRAAKQRDADATDRPPPPERLADPVEAVARARRSWLRARGSRAGS